jgi:hypothetical protein
MIRSREVFTPALDHALLANRVVSVLEHPQTTDATEQRQVFNRCLNFIEMMLKGHDFSQSLQVSDDSYREAQAYGEGVRALRLTVGTTYDENSDPGSFLRSLASTAKKLSEGENASEPEIAPLLGFFRSVRALSMNENRDPLERVFYVIG